MNELVKYDAACRALAVAKSVDEVKDIRDKAIALTVYAKQAKNRQLEIDASEIRIRAERRVGEMIAEQKKTVGLAKPPGKKKIGSSGDPISATPPLAAIGINKHLADRARKLAAMPAEKFEAKLVERREKAEQENESASSDMLKKTTHVSNNSGENEWYTPAEYIEAARKVMGGIDVDPASSPVANVTVDAKKFFTAEQDGLKQNWEGRVWMNPPYAQPLMSMFAAGLVKRIQSGEVDQACVLVNNATETGWFQDMLAIASAVCFVKGRVKFLDPKGKPGAPLQGQTVLYFGSKYQEFDVEFEDFGVVLHR